MFEMFLKCVCFCLSLLFLKKKSFRETKKNNKKEKTLKNFLWIVLHFSLPFFYGFFYWVQQDIQSMWVLGLHQKNCEILLKSMKTKLFFVFQKMKEIFFKVKVSWKRLLLDLVIVQKWKKNDIFEKYMFIFEQIVFFEKEWKGKTECFPFHSFSNSWTESYVSIISPYVVVL